MNNFTKFGAMIATSTIVMFGLMCLNTYAPDHIFFSETRAYFAMVASAAVIFLFVYVALHLKQIERTIRADNLVPVERGPRNNVVLMICVIPMIVVSLLLFLIIKA